MTGSETFEVLDGEVACSLEGRDRVLSAGEVLEVPAGSTHVNPYTTAGRNAKLVQSVVPHPVSVEVYFTSWLMWLEQGETDDHDEPKFLQMMAIAKAGGRGDTWGSGPPVWLQKITTDVLGHVATLVGIRAVRVTPNG